MSNAWNRPRVQADALSGMADHYKIKLRAAGYRLVYRVEDGRLVVAVVAVGKRERGPVSLGRGPEGMRQFSSKSTLTPNTL